MNISTHGPGELKEILHWQTFGLTFEMNISHQQLTRLLRSVQQGSQEDAIEHENLALEGRLVSNCHLLRNNRFNLSLK